jgi:hypothetical protein
VRAHSGLLTVVALCDDARVTAVVTKSDRAMAREYRFINAAGENSHCSEWLS